MQAYRSVRKKFKIKISKGAKTWWVIDAKNKVAGRLASKIVPLLIGKHKPTFNPTLDVGRNFKN
jgi:large subunit ribosomal protein L13